MLNGYIFLHRSMIDWEWYQDPNTMRLFVHCLLSANHKKGKWQGTTIERGQFITSYAHLAEALGLSVQNIRTSMKKLISTGELTHKNNNKNGLITVINYDKYQDINTLTNSQLTHKQHTTNNKQEEKEIKEVKEVYLEFVKLTKTEHNKLIDKYGTDVTNDLIERLNNYIGSKGKKYNSHYHTILSWARKENATKQEKSSADLFYEQLEREKNEHTRQ